MPLHRRSTLADLLDVGIGIGGQCWTRPPPQGLENSVATRPEWGRRPALFNAEGEPALACPPRVFLGRSCPAPAQIAYWFDPP